MINACSRLSRYRSGLCKITLQLVLSVPDSFLVDQFLIRGSSSESFCGIIFFRRLPNLSYTYLRPRIRAAGGLFCQKSSRPVFNPFRSKFFFSEAEIFLTRNFFFKAIITRGYYNYQGIHSCSFAAGGYYNHQGIIQGFPVSHFSAQEPTRGRFS